MLTKVLIVELLCIIFLISNRNRIRNWKEQTIIWKFLIAYLSVGFVGFTIMLVVILLN